MDFKNELEIFDFMEKYFYAGALSDILDEMGYPECAISPYSMIRPLYPEAVCAGRVRTLLNAPARTGTVDPYRLAIELVDSLKPGEVSVASSDKPIECGIMGELSAMAMTRRGARGCIVDGYTRDARKIIQRRFPTFARGVSPIDTTERVMVIEYDCPVIIGGRRAVPGQIVFADLDGIILIPKAVETEVIQEAAKRVNVETQVRDNLSEGATMRDVWDKYHVL
ncbi:MAG: RraA family protein [Candidatus Latescibacter sp.]|nr:RraA family protein [Candidatus Latescibacter sp.]